MICKYNDIILLLCGITLYNECLPSPHDDVPFKMTTRHAHPRVECILLARGGEGDEHGIYRRNRIQFWNVKHSHNNII